MTPEEIEAAEAAQEEALTHGPVLAHPGTGLKVGKGRKEQAIDDRDEWIYEQRKIARQQLKDGER